MSYEPFYIASFEDESGLNQYFEPFLIPEKAMPELEDAYAWRGRIRRRQGFSTLGRLRRVMAAQAMGNIVAAGAGVFTFNIFTGMAVLATEPNAEIELGSTTPISIAIGAPISQTLTDILGTGTMTVVGAGPITGATLNYNTGVLTITFSGVAGASAATFTGAYYPGLPVMGLPNSVTNAINEETLRAFDTKYCYQYVGGLFRELSPPTVWHGNDSDFFWTTTYWPPTANVGKLFWATNFNKGATPDPLRYYNGAAWIDFTPLITATDNLYTCRCIVPYKGRLLVFNTWEGTTAGAIAGAVNFPQRLRYSQRLVNPSAEAPAVPNAWRSDIPGCGGFIDAPTDEQIISVEFIKDTLLVKFERSSWKVVYTGNEVYPFLFEKINTELGAESTFSLVPFDRGVFSIGNVGICTDDSVNVMRIDQKIPDIIFKIVNANNGPKRVHGIRDFATQLVYWAFPNDEGMIFPNKVLVYNYINQTFSLFNDSFTCYGYYQKRITNVWGSYNATTWRQADFVWVAAQNQAQFPDVCAGNQQGFVLFLNQDTFNTESLSIRDITPIAPPTGVTITSRYHNLQTGDFVKITDVVGRAPNNPDVLNDETYRVNVIDINTFTLELYNPGTGVFDTVTLDVGGTYYGGGYLTKVNNVKILTKVFSPFYDDGGQVRVGYVDFLFDRTDEGELTCSVFVDENPYESMSDIGTTDGLLGTDVVKTSPENPTLIPSQDFQKKIWHRFYVQSIAENFQIGLTMSDVQMSSEDISSSEIVLHAMVLYISKNARLIQ